MKHFSAKHQMQDLFVWINREVAGECSVIVDLPYGPAVYVAMGPGLPIWKRVYGPVAKEVRA